MTPITNTAPATKIAPNADQLLRDVAYVLKLTRRVKEEMTADPARTEAPVTRIAEGALVA